MVQTEISQFTRECNNWRENLRSYRNELQQMQTTLQQAVNHPLSKEEWVKLFKQNFRFTGGEIVNEFLMSAGYLPGAHAKNCPVYKR